MKNKYNCISVVSITKALFVALLVILPNLLSAQQSPSIQTGVTFQWSDAQTNDNLNLAATIQSLTIDGVVYNTFVVPTTYEMTRLGPDGNAPNRIRENGAFVGGDSGQANWNANAISAFQDKNLNHYFTANPNGQDICSNFDDALITDAQKQTIFYSPAIPSNEGGVIAVTERGGNNCFYIEAWGIPVGGGPEEKLGETFIRNVGDYRGCDFGVPEAGSDYWKSGRCNENGQTIGVGLFFLDDIAPTGSRITKIEFIGATRDHGDGKFFILQKYAVDQENTNCIDGTYSGNLNVNNTVPDGSTYSVLSGPTPGGQSFTLSADGMFSYVPNDGYTGNVEFEYEVCLPFPNNTVCDRATVSINFVPLPTTPEIEISCTSTNNFVISVTSPLGDEFEYSLNNGAFQSEPDFINLTEGNYIVTVRNSFTECESISPTTPIVLDNLELTGTVSDILCGLEATGAIDITASGGAPPYSYSWSNSATTEDLSGIPGGTYTIIVTDTNACNIISGVFTVNQINEALSASVTAITNVDCNGNSSGNFTVEGSGGTPPYSYSIDAGATSQTSGLFENLVDGDYVVLIIDANDCTFNVDAAIGTDDVESPEITVPATLTIEGCTTADITNGSAVFAYSTSQSGDVQSTFASNPDYNASDDFDIQSITYIDVITSTNNCPIKVLRTFTVTDNCDNTATATQTITVQDTVAPALSLPANITIECTEDESSANTGEATGTDTCGTVTITQSSVETDDCGNTKTISRTWTATDECGNATSAVQIITVEDTTPPTLTLPADITIECGEDESSANTGQAISEDQCGGVRISESDVVIPGCGNTKTIIRTWLSTDNCGNPTSGDQTITVQDTTPPVITAPADITIECNEDESSANTGVAVGSDTCGDVSITQSDDVTATCGNSKTIIRTWTATDACGNITSTDQTITVQDTIPPTITAPADITIECSEDESSANTGQATGADTCGTVTITESDVETDDCGNTKTITRTWTATDECGNATSAVQTITVEDTTPPRLVIPDDVTIECGEDESSANTGLAKAEDNCGGVIISQSDEVIPGCGNTKTIIRTWTTTDTCGNSASGRQTINVVDTTPPTFTVPEDLSIECDVDATDLNITGDVTDEADTCSTVVEATYSDSLADGNCANESIITRTWSLTDECDNTTTLVQTISVVDTIVPTFTVPADLTIECDVDITDLTLTGDVTDEADNCATDLEATYSDSVANGNCVNESVISRTWSLTDTCDNTTTFVQTINVIDTTAPTFTVPADLTIECDVDVTDLSLTGDVTDEADNCATGLEATYSDSVADGNCANESIITRTWSLNDTCDNTTTLVQTINVVDTTPPTFSVPIDIEIECDADATDLSLTGDVTDEADNCATSLEEATYSDSIADGNCPRESVITRTWSLTDACDNTTTLIQTITIRDTTAPTFTVPVDIEIECDTDATDLTLTGDVTDEADNCSTALEATYSDSIAAGNCANESIITRSWTLEDDCDNTTTLIQTITIQDTTAPTFTVPAAILVECDIDLTDLTLTGDVTDEADNCDSGIEATFTDTVETGDCPNASVITRTWSLADSCDNTTLLIQIITLEDTTPPTFSVPADISIECDENVDDLAITGDVTDEADNCESGLEATFTDTTEAGDCPNTSVIRRTWSLTDACDNTTSFLQTITVQDLTPPTFNETLPVDLNAECDAVPTAETLTATDNCGAGQVTFEENIENGTCIGDYIIERIWTTTDSCGNEAEHVQIITVQDNTAPNLVTPFDENITVLCDGIPTAPDLVFEDSCSNDIDVVMGETSNQINDFEDYQVVRTWEVTDDCGNLAVFTQTISVEIGNVIDVFDANRCILDTEFDLFDLLSGDFDMDGTWSVVSGNATLNGSFFDPISVEEIGVYTFKYAITEGPCPTEVEVNVTIDDDCVVLPCGAEDVIIAKTVTANGDNFNEFFTISGVEDCGFVIELQIFNRWGAEIYKNNNYQNNWNGDAKGSSVGGSGKVPTGTYYYIINLRNSGLKPFAGPIYVATTK